MNSRLQSGLVSTFCRLKKSWKLALLVLWFWYQLCPSSLNDFHDLRKPGCLEHRVTMVMMLQSLAAPGRPGLLIFFPQAGNIKRWVLPAWEWRFFCVPVAGALLWISSSESRFDYPAIIELFDFSCFSFECLTYKSLALFLFLLKSSYSLPNT